MSTGRIFGLWFSYLHTTCNGSSVPPQQPRPIHATPPPQQTAASASASVAVAVAVVVAVAATSASTVAVIVTVSPSPPPLPPHFLPCIQLIVVCAPHRRCCCRCLHRCRRRCHNRRCCRHRHRRPRRPLCRCSVTVAIPVPTAIAAALTFRSASFTASCLQEDTRQYFYCKNYIMFLRGGGGMYNAASQSTMNLQVD